MKCVIPEKLGVKQGYTFYNTYLITTDPTSEFQVDSWVDFPGVVEGNINGPNLYCKY